jgi:hypothetical protein
MHIQAKWCHVVVKTALITIIWVSAVGCARNLGPKNHALTVKCGNQNVVVDQQGNITPNQVILLCENGQVEWDGVSSGLTFTVTFTDKSPFKNGLKSFPATNGKAGPCITSPTNCGANKSKGDEDDTNNDIYPYAIAVSSQSSQGAADPHVIIIPGS